MSDQSVGSNHDPSSQDVDSAWLTPNQIMHLEDASMFSERECRMYDHMVLADELINELATALKDCMESIETWVPEDKLGIATDPQWADVLRRVDAIRKQAP